MIRLIDTIDDPFNDGIFHAIEERAYFLQLQSLSWLTQADVIALDQEYYFNHSGDKKLSPLYCKLWKKQEEGKIQRALDILADIIIRKFADKWDRLHVAMVETTYNPVENYNGTETEKVASKVTSTSGSNSGMYAFNVQGGAAPVSESEASTITEGAANDNVRTLEKHGNIGVTSNQDMLNQEISLRDNFNLLDTLMKDVDELLTIAIY